MKFAITCLVWIGVALGSTSAFAFGTGSGPGRIAIVEMPLAGDLDRDGRITVVDYIMITEELVGGLDKSPAWRTVADVNADGVVTPQDARLVLEKAAGRSLAYCDHRVSVLYEGPMDARLAALSTAGPGLIVETDPSCETYLMSGDLLRVRSDGTIEDHIGEASFENVPVMFADSSGERFLIGRPSTAAGYAYGKKHRWIELRTEPIVEIPDDGIDNDGDGQIDYEDPDCAPSGTTYFVSSSEGDDDFDGLSPLPNAPAGSGPKRSANAMVALLNDAGPGDAVLLKRSDEWTVAGSLEVRSAAGDSSAPVILGAYGSGAKPRIVKDAPDVGGATLSIRGWYNGVTSQWLVVENLSLSSTYEGTTAVVVQENVSARTPPHHVTLRRCDIEENDKGVTLQRNAGDILVEDCLIRNNSIASTAAAGKSWGLYSASDRVTIRRNEFDDNGYSGNGYSWHAYVSSRAGVVIEDNTFKNAYTGLKVREMQGAIVRRNTFHDITEVAITVGGDANGPSTDVMIEGNRIFDCGTALSFKRQDSSGVASSTDRVVVRNNLVYQTEAYTDGGVGITMFGDPVTEAFFCNNTFHNIRGGEDLKIRGDLDPASSVTIRNNIFSKTSEASYLALFDTAGIADIDFNLFDVVFTDGLAYGTNRVFGSPEFADASVADFHLTSASVLAIDRGDVSAGVADDDFDLQDRPAGAGWDIGAFEWRRPICSTCP